MLAPATKGDFTEIPQRYNGSTSIHTSLFPFTHSSPLDPDTLNRPYPRQCKWSLNYSIFPYLSLGTCPLYLLSLFLPPSPGIEEGKAEGRFARPLHVFISMYMLIFWGLRNGVSFFFFLSFVDFVSFSFFFLKSIYSAEVQTFRRLGIFQLLLHLALSAFDTIGVFFDKAQVSMLEHSTSAIGSCVMYFHLLSVLPKKEREKKEQRGRRDSKKGALPD